MTKTLRVLQAFRYEDTVLGFSELARRLGMGKSSVHRILTTLLKEGFVAKTPDDRYRLGLRLFEIGQVAVYSLRVREVAHRQLYRLHAESGHTVHLAVLDGTNVVYLDRFDSPTTQRVFARLVHRTPAPTTSLGKCLLAFGTPAAVEAVLAQGLARKAPRTIASRSAFLGALEQVRSGGFAASVEENEPGVSSVGAPVFGSDGSCIAAISLAAASSRVHAELTRLAAMVKRCAHEVSRAMGQGEPRPRS